MDGPREPVISRGRCHRRRWHAADAAWDYIAHDDQEPRRFLSVDVIGDSSSCHHELRIGVGDVQRRCFVSVDGPREVVATFVQG